MKKGPLLPPRPRGRPAVVAEGPASANVHVRMHAKKFDAVYAKAQREQISIPEVFRRALTKLLDEDS